jgi:methyltransferase of ATP-grasp peptide maturase system
MLRDVHTTFLDTLARDAAGDRPDGAGLDPAWLEAFREVRREVFVPRFFVQQPGEPGWCLVEAPNPAWLTGVYSPAALITQIGGDDTNASRARDGRVHGAVTSSSSAPSLMAGMLQALDVHPGQRVLEIGTGTGYNAALLCHRLGSTHVTSIDIDPALVDAAAARLAQLGYTPQLRVGDGPAGWPDRAPFDRIIATVALPRIPDTWIAQTRAGGKILMPLDLIGRAGLMAVLDVTHDPAVGAAGTAGESGGRAQGRFLPGYGGFMSLRANLHHAHELLATLDETAGKSRRTTLPVQAATAADSPFEFLAALLTGGYDWLAFTPAAGGPVQTWLTRPDGSWACHVTTAGAHTVRQGGPGRVWDAIEAAHTEWDRLRRPARDAFGLTVARGEHTLWLGDPDSEHHWPLPST